MHQGSFIRGHGLWEPQGCVHDKGFRRFTSMQLEALLARNVDFMIHRGVMFPFAGTWVFVSHAKVPFNEIEMDQCLNLTFARTREEALRHSPRHIGRSHWVFCSACSCQIRILSRSDINSQSTRHLKTPFVINMFARSLTSFSLVALSLFELNFC